MEKANSSVYFENLDKCLVCHVEGYFNQDTGNKIKKTVEVHKWNEKPVFVLNLEKCSIINSPGISSILEVGFKIIDDFCGSFWICGFDSTKERVFNASGILPTFQSAKNVAEVLKKIELE